MKQITIKTLNKVKRLQLKMFEYGDDENRRGEVNCENALWYKVLKDYTEEEKKELLDLIRWTNDDCSSLLEAKGWKVIKEGYIC